MSRGSWTLRAGSFVPVVLVVAACTGPAGDPGPAGTPGDPGALGAACWDLDQNGQCDLATEDINLDGVCDARDCQGGAGGAAGAGGTGGAAGAEPSTPYVGIEVCTQCHQDNRTEWDRTGHASALSKPDGVHPPSRPFDQYTGGVPDPPLSLPWTSISYVIGGFAWAVRYVRSDGYLLTGEVGSPTQWNFANPTLSLDAGWADYSPGAVLPFDCGSCHATGWIPCAADDPACVRQDGLAGMAGSFFAAGVQCEECHGPGQAHASSPYYVKPTVDRSSEACGKCHTSGEVEQISAVDGLIVYPGPYNELFASKKRIMECIDCHDPHQSVMFGDPSINPSKGQRSDCVTCHEGFDTNQKSATMMANLVQCVDCHMPPMGKVATGDATEHTGDLRSHLFGINPKAGAPQFYTGTDGNLYSEPYISLDYACNHCHGVWTDTKPGLLLESTATGYHQQ